MSIRHKWRDCVCATLCKLILLLNWRMLSLTFLARVDLVKMVSDCWCGILMPSLPPPQLLRLVSLRPSESICWRLFFCGKLNWRLTLVKHNHHLLSSPSAATAVIVNIFVFGHMTITKKKTNSDVHAVEKKMMSFNTQKSAVEGFDPLAWRCILRVKWCSNCSDYFVILFFSGMNVLVVIQCLVLFFSA